MERTRDATDRACCDPRTTASRFGIDYGEPLKTGHLAEDLVRSHEVVDQCLVLQRKRHGNLQGVQGPKPQIKAYRSIRRSAAANSGSRTAKTSSFREMMSTRNWRRKTPASSRLMN